MRKRLLNPTLSGALAAQAEWLPLEHLVTVEVSSEAPGYPVEGALVAEAHIGWRAAQSGEQLIRLLFDRPQDLRRIQLGFTELDVERTQQFSLRWSPNGGQTMHEIVRQQWNFNPQTAAREVEDYQVQLTGVTLLELTIVPDVGGGDAHASLTYLRLV